MDDWFAIGRLIHILLGALSVAAIYLTAQAVCRVPTADPGVSDRARRRLGAPVADSSWFGSNDTRIREGI